MKWFLVAVIVVATTIGEILQAVGMRENGEIHDFRPDALGKLVSSIARKGNIVLSVIAMAISFFAFMALLSIAEMSFAVPATAATYVFETFLAKFILRERVGWRRWTGASLVACGVALLSV